MNKYYVYMHIKETDGTPFYVGKGKGRRAYQVSKRRRSKLWNRYYNKYGFDVIILENELNEEQSFEIEKYWIKRLGRIDLGTGILVNHTEGGEGVSGRIYVTSEETKLKLSIAHTGKKLSEETKLKLSIAHIGKNTWTKGKDSVRKGKTNSEEHRLKISEALKGKPSWNKGKELTEEHKKNLRKPKKIKKQKISIDGVIYESITDASIELNINYFTLASWFRNDSEKYNKYKKL